MSSSLARAAARLRRPALGVIGDTITKHPFKSALAITTAKTVAADLLVQFAIERREWEARRTALFAAFGLIYQGAVQYLFVNIVIERLFPGQSLRAVLAKCGMMNGFCDPCFFLPTFYVFKAAVFSDVVSVQAWVSTGFGNYTKNCWKDWYDVVRVWAPADIVCFSVPLYLRLPVRHVVSFVWTAYLSFARGGH